MPEKVGKLATIIHTLNCVFNGQPVTNHIPRSAVEAAAKFVKFTADQVASLYTEFSDRAALAPNLTKILLVAERKGGTISVRDAQVAFTAKFRPSAQVVREYFRDLAALKYGEVFQSGKTFYFQLTKPGSVGDSSSNPSGSGVSTDPTPGSVGDSWDHFVHELSPTDPQLIQSHIQLQPIQGEGLSQLSPTDPDFTHLSENVRECIKFIKTAVAENDPETAKNIQEILVKINPRHFLGSTNHHQVGVVLLVQLGFLPAPQETPHRSC